jgi:hypothetical protein
MGDRWLKWRMLGAIAEIRASRAVLLFGAFFGTIYLRLLLLSSFLTRVQPAAGQPVRRLFFVAMWGAGAQIAFRAVRAAYE